MPNFIDLTGRVFSSLTVIKKHHPQEGRIIHWDCICSCGKKTVVSGGHLTSGHTKSCGCRIRDFDDITGRRFGKLLVLKRVPSNIRKNLSYWCVCDCGIYKICQSSNLKSGCMISCGCARKDLYPRGEDNHRWRGGRKKAGVGYVKIYKPGHANAKDGIYVREHVFIMSEHIGRPLLKGETVHHKNGIRDDNRIENLELWASSHPKGQRIEDLVVFAHEVLQKYGTLCINPPKKEEHPVLQSEYNRDSHA